MRWSCASARWICTSITNHVFSGNPSITEHVLILHTAITKHALIGNTPITNHIHWKHAQGNLVVNVIKEMAGKTKFDTKMVSNFEISAQVRASGLR